jgi:hypothetical protein
MLCHFSDKFTLVPIHYAVGALCACHVMKVGFSACDAKSLNADVYN